jgi:hypothetical protein
LITVRSPAVISLVMIEVPQIFRTGIQ